MDLKRYDFARIREFLIANGQDVETVVDLIIEDTGICMIC